MSVVAVIPARGGSAGVPGKNLRSVGGVPLIVRAIRAARAVPAISRVIVSTDDDAIALAAVGAGAEVVTRPPELAGATAAEPVLLHALAAIACDAAPVEVLVLLRATSPFIDPDALARAVERVASGAEDSVFAAVPTRVRLWSDSGAGAVGVNHDAEVRARGRDRDTHWAETGAFYVLRTDGFRTARHRFFGRIGVAEVDPRGALEIQTLADLELADALAPFLDGRAVAGAPPVSDPHVPASASPALPSPAARIEADAVAVDPRVMPTEERVVVLDDGHAYLPRDPDDGRAAARLSAEGLPLLLVSAELRPVARLEPVRADNVRGSDDKAAAVRYWAEHRGVALDRVVYIGTGPDDLPALAVVGWPVCTADAPQEVRAACRVVLDATAAGGAVHEVVDRMLRPHPEHPPLPATPPIHEIVRTERTIHDLARPAR